MNQRAVEIQENDTIVLQPKPDGYWVFSIQRDQRTVFSWEYRRAEISPPVSAFHMINSAVSEEDFDIFLFIHNVINDRQRRNRVFRQEDEPK